MSTSKDQCTALAATAHALRRTANNSVHEHDPLLELTLPTCRLTIEFHRHRKGRPGGFMPDPTAQVFGPAHANTQRTPFLDDLASCEGAATQDVPEARPKRT